MTKFSQQHYEVIADVLKGFYDKGATTQRHVTERIARALADYFEEDNERFSRSKFAGAIFGEDNELLIKHF